MSTSRPPQSAEHLVEGDRASVPARPSRDTPHSAQKHDEPGTGTRPPCPRLLGLRRRGASCLTTNRRASRVSWHAGEKTTLLTPTPWSPSRRRFVTDRGRMAGERSRWQRPSVHSRRRSPWRSRRRLPRARRRAGGAFTVQRATCTVTCCPARYARSGHSRMRWGSDARSTRYGLWRTRARVAGSLVASAPATAARGCQAVRPGAALKSCWAAAVASDAGAAHRSARLGASADGRARR